MKLSSTCSFISNKGMGYSKKRRKKYMTSQKANGANPYPFKKKLSPISFSVPHIIQIKEIHVARSDPEYLELGLPPKIPHTCTF